MKKKVLFALMFTTSTSFGQFTDCADLFISEYVSGLNNNRGLEIFNPTDFAIDLGNYIVYRYPNGASTVTTSNAVQLSGTIAPQDVFVAVIEKLNPNGTGQETPVSLELQAKADGFFCPVFNTSNAFYWDGNDAIVLAKGTINDVDGAIVMDIFGKIGENPGLGWTTVFPYTSGGVVVSANHSLIRKPTVLRGEVNSTISFFNPLDEYDSIPAEVNIGGQNVGNWFSLGAHTCDCPSSLSIKELEHLSISVFPNPSNGVFFVKGDFTEILVLNALGQEVNKTLNSSKSITNIKINEEQGVYFLKVRNGDSEITKRIIVQ